RTKRVNHCRPAAVSHHHDSGWESRRCIAWVSRCTLLFDNPVLRATCRTLCVPWSQRHLKIRTLLAQNVMSVSALKGDRTLGRIQSFSVPDRHPTVPRYADTRRRCSNAHVSTGGVASSCTLSVVLTWRCGIWPGRSPTCPSIAYWGPTATA